MQDTAPLQTQSGHYVTPTSSAPQTLLAVQPSIPAAPASSLRSGEFILSLVLIVGLLALLWVGKVPTHFTPVVIAFVLAWFTQHRSELKKYHLDGVADALAQSPGLPAPIREVADALAEPSPDDLGMVGKVPVIARGTSGQIDPTTIIILAVLAAIALVPACRSVGTAMREDASGERWTEVGYQADATPRVTINGAAAR